MATKISAEMAKTLKNLGINAKTEEEAHKKLVAALEKEGIEGMEDESLTALIDMADGFLNENATIDDDEEEDLEEVNDDEEPEEDTDEEMDALAKEVEEEAEKDSEPEEADDEVDDEPEAEEEEEVVLKKKKVKKEKPAKENKAEKAEATEEKKKSKRTPRSQKLDPKNNPEDREPLEEIKKLFGENYTLEYLVSNGATVKHVGKNGKRGVVTIENLKRKKDDRLYCNMYLLTMAKQVEILDELDIEDYSICWSKIPEFKGITLESAKGIIESVIDVIKESVEKIDRRLGDNRKKMEESLKKSEKKVAKEKPAKKSK